ncbi:hypothetical protein [Chitinilyticum aquatile]|uniref:hypothetical protein n=1 Tax=Chitinilyticum aquatile TaxID=362520 RepID=UPI00040F7B2A|nr:hypothetical protein [Chitinilyticum aquatile]
MGEPLFYLQDSRGYVGNDMMFWAQEGAGYTTDLRKAQKYTLAEAQAQHDCRHTDIPWPCEYIEARTRPAVDMQYVKRDEALEGSGIILTITKPEKIKKERFRCYGCGVFLTAVDYYCGPCGRCGAENRP